MTWHYSITNDIDFYAGRTVLLLAESGPQATVLDGGNATRLVDFPSGVASHTALIKFALQNGRAAEGGAIRCEGASPLISGCIVSGSRATEDGGGLFISDGSPRVVNCTFTGNSADDDGGGVGCNGSTIELNRCALLDNWAHADGGGLRAKDSQPRVRNSLFARNRAYREGGGVHIKGPTAVLALENCTVTDNRARLVGGGMAASDVAIASATNSIFWGNAPDQLYGVSGLAHCCVEGGAPGTAILTNHPGLTAVYYRLLPESACIDAGTNAAWMTEATDLHGKARIGDNTVDIGADEWHGAVSGGDAPGAGTPGGVWPLSTAPDPDRLRLEFSVGDPRADDGTIRCAPPNGFSAARVIGVAASVGHRVLGCED